MEDNVTQRYNNVSAQPDYVLKDLQERANKAKWGAQFDPCLHPTKHIAMLQCRKCDRFLSCANVSASVNDHNKHCKPKACGSDDDDDDDDVDELMMKIVCVLPLFI